MTASKSQFSIEITNEDEVTLVMRHTMSGETFINHARRVYDLFKDQTPLKAYRLDVDKKLCKLLKDEETENGT